MKNIFFLFLLFLSASSVPAQQPVAPELIILKKKWSLTVPTSGSGSDYLKTLRAQAEAERDSADLKNEFPLASSRLTTTRFTVTPLKDYRYEIKVKNTGTKTIERISWEYVFKDLKTNEQTGIVYLVSKTAIKPGKTQQIIERSTLRPAKNLTINRVGKQIKPEFKEEIRINYIEYTDGSAWKGSN